MVRYCVTPEGEHHSRPFALIIEQGLEYVLQLRRRNADMATSPKDISVCNIAAHIGQASAARDLGGNKLAPPLSARHERGRLFLPSQLQICSGVEESR